MAAITLTDVLRVHPDVVWRELDGEVVLLNVVTGLYYGLDDVGAAVWRHLADAPATVQTVRDALVDQFDGDPAIIERDLLHLAGKLADSQLLVLSA
jgi:hypothetical protein